ncbi:MAG: DUF1934 domain-containing protein [Thermoanaerobacteraceae bacterium]|nr:DUF1934 domain-containing protein [Thermoanaerobacteraceae bacterium]
MKKVLVTVKGIQTNDQNEQGIIELVTEGKFLRKGDNYYIKYDESEISGMDGTTTTLKVSDDVITLIRFGSNQAKMIFKKDKRYQLDYITPYGKVLLGIKPYKLFVNMNENGGELEIKYDLDLNKEIVSNNELHLTVREVNNG